VKIKSGCARWVVALGVILAALALAAGAAVLGIGYLRNRQTALRAGLMPPTVYLTSPTADTPTTAGGHLAIAATAFGSRPISRVEFWLDGQVIQVEQNAGLAEAAVPFDATADALLTEGPHMLFVRAVDKKGLVGQAMPLSFVAAPKGDQVYYSAAAQAGETLADVATRLDADPGVVQQANPDLGSGGLPAGTTVNIPVSAEDEPTEAPAPPAQAAVTTPNVPMLRVVQVAPVFDFLAVQAPVAAANLEVQLEDCQVTLVWTDNANNETAYEVWFAPLGAGGRKFASLTPASGGQAWFRFPAPGPGAYGFWLEAVNAVGRQPSNPVLVEVGGECPTTRASELRIEALAMTVSPGVERAYCYVSFEGAPEIRIPYDQNMFIGVQGGQGDIAAWGAGNASSIMPMPADNSLELSGECWGRSGGSLGMLGTFSNSLPAEMWDGTARALRGGTFEIDVSAATVGAVDATGMRATFGERSAQPGGLGSNNGWVEYTAGGIPPPARIEGLRLKGLDSDFCDYTTARECILQWRWVGTRQPGQLMNVIVIGTLNGQPYWDSRVALGDIVGLEGENEVRVPVGLFWCGKSMSFAVQQSLYQPTGPGVVPGGGSWCAPEGCYGSSVAKASLEERYVVAQCESRFIVKFDYIDMPWTGEGLDPGPCDEIEAYYSIGVDGRHRDFYGGCSFGVACFTLPLRCGWYTFAQLAPPGAQPPVDTITVDVPDPAAPVDLSIWSFWYDYDDISDDVAAFHTARYKAASFWAAQKDLGCAGKSFLTDMWVNDTMDSRIQYTVSVAPCLPPPAP